MRRVPPTDTTYYASSNPAFSAGPPSTAQVVALVREAMRNALNENKTKAAEASEVGKELTPGVTVDLSSKDIRYFPEEVIDIIKNEIERLALSHNQISALPSRLPECSSLRYLNIKDNKIREFPITICQVGSLEILDLGRNKIKILPPELFKLSSLKVLSVEKNRIEILPHFLGDMTSLQILKVGGNPIVSPAEVIDLQVVQTKEPNGEPKKDEPNWIFITGQIKGLLQQEKAMQQQEKALQDRSETESGGEESSEDSKTPRPMKRVMSGRFPIKVNGSDVPDLRSPNIPRPPPIPSRSHYRGLSQQNAALRRPGVTPLNINGQSANERLRSNSENVLQGSRSSTIGDRSRRMGIVTKKSELGTVDEGKSNRHSHYRGLSHGSAMSGSINGIISSMRSPASPADFGGTRPGYVRRLSSLPERKRQSGFPDTIMESAQGILFALYQVHPHVQNLLSLSQTQPTNKRMSLERVFYNANTHVDELDRDIVAYEVESDEDEDELHQPPSNENVHRACSTAVGAYVHVCQGLKSNIDALVDDNPARYIRSLLLLIYGGVVETRNASNDLLKGSKHARMPSISENIDYTLRSLPRDRSITPKLDRRDVSRSRSGTVLQHSSMLRVATDTASQPLLSSSLLLTSATPRSGDSFASSNGSRVVGDFSAEDQIFEQIFLKLRSTAEMSMKNLPAVIGHFQNAMQICSQQVTPDQPRIFWEVLIKLAENAFRVTELLRNRLSLIKLKEPGIRTQGAFWELCNAFVESYTVLMLKVKEAKAQTSIMSMEVITLLRPLQKSVKSCGQSIQASPWSHLATQNSLQYSIKSPDSQVPLPMTPQSAALGPAVQATVPSTPQTISYNAMFSGNVFERADAYLSMSSSAASSRTGTMTSTDGMIPATALSPLNSFNGRFNNISKAF
ncbi:RAM signaling pathway protein-domain-containing protein [Bisporella sp. PMI_857]|nr:RAM signaling pathway protein-domain-containing protein [Bisporella sp. PMI_857]